DADEPVQAAGFTLQAEFLGEVVEADLEAIAVGDIDQVEVDVLIAIGAPFAPWAGRPGPSAGSAPIAGVRLISRPSTSIGAEPSAASVGPKIAVLIAV